MSRAFEILFGIALVAFGGLIAVFALPFCLFQGLENHTARLSKGWKGKHGSEQT